MEELWAACVEGGDEAAGQITSEGLAHATAMIRNHSYRERILAIAVQLMARQGVDAATAVECAEELVALIDRLQAPERER